MKVSVVVPVCNTSKYLRQCLDSLINQTLKDIEIICVDDGSTDCSGAILDEYAQRDARLQVIHKVNTGYGNSMNIGMSSARGEYVGILESDDFAEPDMYERLYTTAVKHQAEVVKGNYNQYFEIENKYTAYTEILDFDEDVVFSPEDVPRIYGLHPSVWSSIYKNTFFRENDIAFLETPGASFQDIDFAFKVFTSVKRLVILKSPVLNYRMDNAASSIHNPQKIFCVCDELAEIYDYIQRRSVGGKLTKQWEETVYKIAGWIKFRNYEWNYYRLGIEYQYAFLMHIRDEIRAIAQSKPDRNLWYDRDLDALMRMSGDINQFYQETHVQGADTDSRLQLLNTYNNTFAVDRFHELLNMFCEISIYGAGTVGKRVYHYLKKANMAAKVKSFVVTNRSGNENDIDHVAVETLLELPKPDVSKRLFIVAVSAKLQYDIAAALSNAGAEHILLINDEINAYICTALQD